MNIELLYFEDCPNHELAERLVRDVLDKLALDVSIRRIAVPDETAGIAVRFPGSPTIRVDGVDVEPGFLDCDDCTPRCRIYSVDGRLTGLPAREWLAAALRRPSSTPPAAVGRGALPGRTPQHLSRAFHKQH